jgi:hypothetical protein
MLAVFAGIPSPLKAGLPVPASVVIIPPLSERLGYPDHIDVKSRRPYHQRIL